MSRIGNRVLETSITAPQVQSLTLPEAHSAGPHGLAKPRALLRHCVAVMRNIRVDHAHTALAVS